MLRFPPLAAVTFVATLFATSFASAANDDIANYFGGIQSRVAVTSNERPRDVEPVCFRDTVCCDSACGDSCDGGCGCSDACGCAVKSKKPNPCATSHKILHYNNDFSYLKNSCGSDCLGDCLKLMPVDRCGRWGTLDIGGQLRLRYHNEKGMAQQAGATRFQDTENDILLSRLRLYGNWKINDNVRVFVEGISAGESSNDAYIPRGIDTNYGDLLNAFIDFQLTESFSLRVGRQELLFGAQRTVSPLDWANTRRTFEGVRGTYKKNDWTVDGFYTNFVPVDNDDFDEADYDRSFYGLYNTYAGFDNKTVDLYYLGYDDERAAQDFSLHTFGARVNGTYCDKYLYEMEGAYQGGRQSGLGLDHDAGFLTLGVGKKFKHKWDPTLWLYFDYASGNAGGGDFNRYNHLYPLAHKYHGFIDAVQRSNIESPNVLLTFSPAEKWKMLVWYHYFGANQEGDIVPSVGGTPAQNATDDFGSEIDLVAKYQIGPRSNVLFGYSRLGAGSKIIATKDAEFFYGQWTLNF